MAGRDSLKKYRRKRDFSKTGEPEGGIGDSKGKPVFVIQKHDASSLHYDFRLEIDGVLVSWAVPKGLSTDPREKRLAVKTEDHPLAYAEFEGVIPEGEYGAGPVLIWDRGTYRNLKNEDGKEVEMGKAVEQGHVAVWLEGEKLRGGYALTRVDYRGKDDWLVVKMRDKEADARRRPVNTQPESVESGRTIEEIAKEEQNST